MGDGLLMGTMSKGGGDGVKQDYQCYRCGLWYDDKDTMKECVKECKEEGR